MEAREPNTEDIVSLVERLQSGEERAVAELAETYRPRIHQTAMRLLQNDADAEEVAQDVLLKAIASIARFRGEAALSSWLYRITFNTAMSRLRHRRAARIVEIARQGKDAMNAGAGAADIADWSGLADEAVLRQQMRRRLDVAMRALPAIYRAPVLLRDVRGMTTGEASSALRLNDKTLKSRLHRGRRLLRSQLQDFADGLILHRAAS